MLRVGVHAVAYEMYVLPGRRAQHSACVTFSAYKPLQRPADSIFNQHNPRSSSAVTAAGDTVSPATSTAQLADHLFRYQFTIIFDVS